MTVNIISQNDKPIAIVESPVITPQDALDMIATVSYNHKCNRIALNKSNLSEEFFKLSTGLAGEILQKFINFRAKVAIIGDFTDYTSKPLHDFIYECNSGNDIFFVSTIDEALERLAKAK